MRVFLALLFALFFLSSCSQLRGRAPQTGEPIVIRYVNLKYIYDFMITKNKDSQEIAREKTSLLESLKNMESQMVNPKAVTPELALNYNRQKQLYVMLESQENDHKKMISQRIHRAMLNIAEKTGVDFILNIGDEVIYAKKKYDVTEDIIREVIDINKRSEPVSR